MFAANYELCRDISIGKVEKLLLSIYCFMIEGIVLCVFELNEELTVLGICLLLFEGLCIYSCWANVLVKKTTLGMDARDTFTDVGHFQISFFHLPVGI